MQLPKLMQRLKHKPPEDDLAGKALLSTRLHCTSRLMILHLLHVPPDGAAEADAEKAVRAASKIAEAAVSKAVQAAALAGLEYMPPPDLQLDTPRVAKVHACLQLYAARNLQLICLVQHYTLAVTS